MTDISDARRHQREAIRGPIADSSAVRESAPFVGVASECALSALQLSPYTGGVDIVGPTAGPLPAIDALISSSEVEAVEACGGDLSDWISSPDEILLLSRQVSSILRTGRSVVIHLDSHLEGAAEALPRESWAFVCSRLGRVTVGLADDPAYVAVHGEDMAQGFLDAIGDVDPPAIGEIGDTEVCELTNQSFLRGVPFAVVPGNRTATAVVQTVDWLESRRCLS